MKRQRSTVKAEDCAHCPACKVDGASAVCASNFSVIPSRLVAQVTEGVWNAVVTTLGKGTFLIRRSKNLPANACPLRAYEVRHVEAEARPRRKRVKNPAGHAKEIDSCGDLFVRILTGRV